MRWRALNPLYVFAVGFVLVVLVKVLFLVE